MIGRRGLSQNASGPVARSAAMISGPQPAFRLAATAVVSPARRPDATAAAAQARSVGSI